LFWILCFYHLRIFTVYIYIYIHLHMCIYIYTYLFIYLFIYIIAWSYAHDTIFIGHPIPQNSQPLLLLTMVLTLCAMIIPIPWSPRRGNPLKPIEILYENHGFLWVFNLGGMGFLSFCSPGGKVAKKKTWRNPLLSQMWVLSNWKNCPRFACLPTFFGWPVDFRKTCCEVYFSRKMHSKD